MATKAERRRLRRIIKTSFPFPFNVDRFVDRAIRQFPEDPASFAYALIIRSKPFRRRFPGITKADGTLRIAPTEYLQREEQFRSTAAQFGFNVNRRMIGGLISKNVDPQEFVTRARGIQLTRQNPGLAQSLNQQIRAINQRRARAAKGGDFQRIPLLRDRKDIMNFFTGRADRQLYRVYEAAVFQTAAEEAGIDITRGRGKRLAQRTAGVIDFEEAQQGFADIAAQLRLAGVELRAAGLSERDLETLEFGGPGQAEIASRAQRVLQQRQAALQQPAVGQQVELTEDRRPIVPPSTDRSGE